LRAPEEDRIERSPGRAKEYFCSIALPLLFNCSQPTGGSQKALAPGYFLIAPAGAGISTSESGIIESHAAAASEGQLYIKIGRLGYELQINDCLPGCKIMRLKDLNFQGLLIL
jgi:hypothetical protein